MVVPQLGENALAWENQYSDLLHCEGSVVGYKERGAGGAAYLINNIP